MRSKVLKIGTVLLACVCLISFMAVPVSAVTVGGATINMYKGYFRQSASDAERHTASIAQDNGASYDANMSIINPVSVATNWGSYAFFSFSSSVTYGTLTITVSSSGDIYDSSANELFSCTYEGQRISSLNCDIVLDDTEDLITYTYFGQIPAYFCITTWARYSASSTTLVSDYYNIAFQGYDISTDKIIENAEDNTSSIISNANDNTNDIIDNQNQTASDIQQNADDNASDIQANADKNASDIQANQDKNTSEITDGWGGADDIDDSTASDFTSAEDAALGGKTDAEIQDEVDNALSFDISVFDSTKVGKIHSLFDNVLDALGSSWQALFLLSLTLGLGAFLIGRRYG